MEWNGPPALELHISELGSTLHHMLYLHLLPFSKLWGGEEQWQPLPFYPVPHVLLQLHQHRGREAIVENLPPPAA